jgi:hypothetical protein
MIGASIDVAAVIARANFGGGTTPLWITIGIFIPTLLVTLVLARALIKAGAERQRDEKAIYLERYVVARMIAADPTPPTRTDSNSIEDRI